MYQLKYVPNTETHADFHMFIVIVDEDGKTVGNCGFGTQEHAFDYIQTDLEKDEQYKNFITKPEIYAKDIYDALDDWNKSLLQKYLVSRYKDQCMYEYFMKEVE